MTVRLLSPEAGALPRLVVDAPALILQNARAIWEAGRIFLDGKEKIIDLAAVKEVDSAALAILLEWQRENDALAHNKREDRNKPNVPEYSNDCGGGMGAGLHLEAVPASLLALAELYNVDKSLGFS